MKGIINTNIDPTARFEIRNSVIKNSAVKCRQGVIYLSTFKGGLFSVW